MPNYNYSWNSAANTIISSLEGYQGFCSVIMSYLCYICIGCQQKPISTTEVNIEVFTQSDILWLMIHPTPILLQEFFVEMT